MLNKIAPFRSEKQRRYLWKFHPDIAERWTKEHGSKIVPSKKNSRLEKINLILAQQTAPVDQAQVDQVPIGANQPIAESPVTPGEPAGQTAYANIDFNAAITMIPQIMKQLNTTQIPAIRDYMVNTLKADPNVAQQSTTSFAVKIYREEANKRRQQLIEDVGKKLGIDPTKIQNIGQNAPLPALPGMQAFLNRKKRIARIIKSDFTKKADVAEIVEEVDNLSPTQKLNNLYHFFSGFDSISEGVKSIFDFISNFDTNFPPPPMAPATAQMSKKIGGVAAFLWVVSFIIVLGAAGTSDFNARYYTHLTDVDKLKEAHAIMLAVKSMGLSAIVTGIAHFFKKREEKENQSRPKEKKLYEPFNK